MAATAVPVEAARVSTMNADAPIERTRRRGALAAWCAATNAAAAAAESVELVRRRRAPSVREELPERLVGLGQVVDRGAAEQSLGGRPRREAESGVGPDGGTSREESAPRRSGRYGAVLLLGEPAGEGAEAPVGEHPDGAGALAHDRGDVGDVEPADRAQHDGLGLCVGQGRR